MMFCSKCGSQVADNAAFCTTCGQSTGAQAAPVSRGIPVAPGGFGAQTPGSSSPSAAMPVPPSSPASYAAARPVGAVGYAGFWLRFVAYIIDYIILNVGMSFITIPMMARTGLQGWVGHPPQSPEELAAFVSTFAKIGVIAFVANWLYFSLLESSKWQATIGKKTLGLEVTDMAGQRISFGRATGRYFGKIISAIILFVGFVMAGFTERKQALHDMMANCLVIRKI